MDFLYIYAINIHISSKLLACTYGAAHAPLIYILIARRTEEEMYLLGVSLR